MRSTFSLLGTIKCSTCAADVDIAELGDHVCAPPKQEEPVYVLKKKTPGISHETSKQGKHALPPIDPEAANRPYLNRDEPTPRSNRSGSQEISPATPADGQPLTQSYGNGPQLKESASSSVYTTETPGDAGVSPQHLYALPPDDALYALDSPTVHGGKSLMEKLNSIAPGPFALNASSPPPLSSSSYGERPLSLKGKQLDTSFSPTSGGLSSPEPGLIHSHEKMNKDRLREEAERKLNGDVAEGKGRDRESMGSRRPSTSGSDRSARSKGSESPKPVPAAVLKPKPLDLEKSSYEEVTNNAGIVPVEVEKPPPSPSYQAYRPPQPPQRIPRSPTFPDRPRTPAAYGQRLNTSQRPPIGLPSSPAHHRQKPNVNRINPKTAPLPQQLRPNSPLRQPSVDDDDRSGSAQRGLDRLTPNDRNRSLSRPGTRGGNRDMDTGKQEPSPVGSPYRNSPLSASRNPLLSSSSSSRNLTAGSTSSRTEHPEIPNSKPLPLISHGSRRSASTSSRPAHPDIPISISKPSPKPSPSISGHQKQKPNSRSARLSDIDSLMKDLQDSMRDLTQASPVTEDHNLRSPQIPPSPLHVNRPKTPNDQAPTSAKQNSPTRKTAAKSNCRGCGEAIQGKGLTSSDGRLTGRYHKECFVCQTCREPFSSSTFYVFDNFPYCSRHYHTLNNSLCKRCDIGIEGPCLETERNERLHPHCFTCTDCHKILGDDYFELGGNPYCEQHAHRIMQQRSRLGPGRSMGKMERRRTRLMMM